MKLKPWESRILFLVLGSLLLSLLVRQVLIALGIER